MKRNLDANQHNIRKPLWKTLVYVIYKQSKSLFVLRTVLKIVS